MWVYVCVQVYGIIIYICVCVRVIVSYGYLWYGTGWYVFVSLLEEPWKRATPPWPKKKILRVMKRSPEDLCPECPKLGGLTMIDLQNQSPKQQTCGAGGCCCSSFSEGRIKPVMLQDEEDRKKITQIRLKSNPTVSRCSILARPCLESHRYLGSQKEQKETSPPVQ